MPAAAPATEAHRRPLSWRGGPVVLARPPADDLSSWVAGRMEAQEAAVLGTRRRKVGLMLRDGADRIVGGLTGYALGADFYVHLLWVDEAARTRGLGTVLMRAAEREAATQGCARIFVNTMEFQAPGFYTKLGYALLGVMPNFTWNAGRHYFRKTVVPADLPALPDGLRLDRSAPPTGAEVEAVEEGLTRHWNRRTPESYRLIGAAVADGAGGRAAGATAVIDGAWFTLADLWVEPNHRGRGLAAAILDTLEAEAAVAGCRHATGMPMGWQAPDLFARRGYAVALHMDDYLLGRSRTWFRKTLDRA